MSKYFITVEIQVDNAENLEDAARTALDTLRAEEYTLEVGTMSGPQESETFSTTDLE